MPGMYKYSMEIESNVKQLLSDMKEAQDRLDTLEGKEYTIKLNIDEKKLGNVISNLEKMLDSLGKGTGDFKQFENLSKELSAITSEVKDFSKAFGKLDDSGAKTLLSSIQNIDKSLSELSQNILNVNKNMGNMGNNTNGAVKQVENIGNAAADAAKQVDKLAEAQSKLGGNKTNISLGDSSTASAEKFQQITNDTVNVLSDVGKTEDQIVQKIQKERAEAEANNEVLREHLVLLDKAGKVVANHWGSTSNVNGTYTDEQLSQAQGGKIIHAHPGKASFFGGKDLQHLLQDSMYDQIKQIELIWGDSTLSVDKSTLTKQSSSTILNIMRNVRKALTEAYGDNQDGAPSREAREHINAIEKEIFKSIAQKLNVSVTEDGSMAKEVTDSLSDVDKAIIKRFSEIKASIVQDVDASNIIKSTMKDAFQGENIDTSTIDKVEVKLDNSVISAKELDKALDGVDIPTNGFDDVLSKLDRTKSELVDIVKITKSWVADAEGKGHEAYTLKDSRGSSEIYGISSNTNKGQILRQNIVQYDASSESKEIKKIIDENIAYNKKYYDSKKKEEDSYQKLRAKYLAEGRKQEEQYYKEQQKKNDSQVKMWENLLHKRDEAEQKQLNKDWDAAIAENNKRDAETAKQQAKEIQAEWDKNVKAIQDYMNAVTKLNNLKAKDAGSEKYSSQIELQTKNVEELKQAAYEARANLSSMINPHEVDITTWDKWLDMMEQFDKASEGSAESVAKLKDALRNARNSELDSIISTNTTRIENLKNSKPVESDRSVKYQGYINQLDEIQTKIVAIQDKAHTRGFVTDEDIQNVRSLQESYDEIDTKIKQMKKSEKGSTEVSRQKEIDKLNKAMQANTNITAEARQQLQGYLDKLRYGNASTNVEEIHTAWQKVINDEIAAGRGGTSFIQMMKNSGIHKWAADIAGMFSFYDVINIGKQGIQTIRELDTALTEMRKVSDEATRSLKNYQSTTFDVADAVGTTALQIQQSTADYMRLGESLEQASESAKTANILLNVSEFNNIEDATSALTSMGQAYKDLDKLTIVDKLNEVGK